MKTAVITQLLLVLFASQGIAQHISTTDIYSASIDTVLEVINFKKGEAPVLILAPRFYEKNIETYKGGNKIASIKGFGNTQEEWIGKELIYLDLSPITVSKKNLIVVVMKSKVSYKSKKRWKLDNGNEEFYYVTFKYDCNRNEYRLSELTNGKYCPDTIN